jgi:hypothetical protein
VIDVWVWHPEMRIVEIAPTLFVVDGDGSQRHHYVIIEFEKAS